ncbi:hypothetical protein [Microcoleus sp. CAWBG640]|uniref:hypothetical protein n=1 Tax=Microcoleus sp. CAWBG640 TaxID=2841653 RepID=UPI00312B3C5E
MNDLSQIDLPLYELFNQLRKVGFPLGICEYNLLIEALETDVYPLDPESLKQLLKTIWVKTNSQRQQFEAIFDQALPQKLDSSDKSPKLTNLDTSNSPEARQIPTSTIPVTPRELKGKSFFFPATSQAPVSASPSQDSDGDVKAVKTRQPDYVAFKPTQHSDDYLPVTGQQMVQGWYNLRRSVRTGNKLELDVAATIEQIKSQGKFVLPVLKPRRLKYSSLLLLIDQKGSMQPFHVLSRQLVATAQQTGCLASQSCYYFHNYPNDELYCDSQFNTEISVEEVLAGLSSQHTVVLIFSDAGAARRDYIPRRIRETKDFLNKLKQEVKTIVWLNPVPKSAWEETTAAAIAKLNNIKMFAADSAGFQKAINIMSCYTEILHHSQKPVGAGSPTALKLANRLNKPALPHRKSLY